MFPLIFTNLFINPRIFGKLLYLNFVQKTEYGCWLVKEEPVSFLKQITYSSSTCKNILETVALRRVSNSRCLNKLNKPFCKKFKYQTLFFFFWEKYGHTQMLSIASVYTYIYIKSFLMPRYSNLFLYFLTSVFVS